MNTFELRMPPPALPLVGDSISFVMFWDMGNAFQYSGDMFKSIEHFHQPDKAKCRDLAGPLAAAGGNASEAVGTCNFNYYSRCGGVGDSVWDAGGADSGGLQLQLESANLSGV